MNDSPDDTPVPAGGERPADGAFAGAEADARPIKPLPGPAPAPVASTAASTAARPARHGVRRFLAWWLAFALVATVACAICLAIGLHGSTPIHIVIDGDDVTAGLSTDGTDYVAVACVAMALFAAAMLAMLIVPLVAIVVVGAVAFALVAGLGTPILVLALVLAVLTSPVWLVGLLVWFLARRRQAHSATIAA